MCAEFNRFDIAEAHCLLESDYNVGGWLRERPSNGRRREATAVQLHRIGFHARPNLSFDTLSENAKEIYLCNMLKLKLPFDDATMALLQKMFTPEFLAQYPVEKKAFSGMYEAVQ
jgi:hypothetical protein